MVYGTYNELVTAGPHFAVYVAYVDNLFGLVAWIPHLFSIETPVPPFRPETGVNRGVGGVADGLRERLVGGYLEPTKVTIISGGLEIGWIDWRDGQMDNQYVLYIYVRI